MQMKVPHTNPRDPENKFRTASDHANTDEGQTTSGSLWFVSVFPMSIKSLQSSLVPHFACQVPGHIAQTQILQPKCSHCTVTLWKSAPFLASSLDTLVVSGSSAMKWSCFFCFVFCFFSSQAYLVLQLSCFPKMEQRGPGSMQIADCKHKPIDLESLWFTNICSVVSKKKKRLACAFLWGPISPLLMLLAYYNSWVILEVWGAHH